MDKPIKTFVALERGSGRGIKQTIDKLDNQSQVSEKVARWVREGYDVQFMDVDVAALVPHE